MPNELSAPRPDPALAAALPPHSALSGLTLAVFGNTALGVLALLPAMMGASVFGSAASGGRVSEAAVGLGWIALGYGLLVVYWRERVAGLSRALGVVLWATSALYNGLVAGGAVFLLLDAGGWLTIAAAAWAGFMLWLSVRYVRRYLDPLASPAPST